MRPLCYRRADANYGINGAAFKEAASIDTGIGCLLGECYYNRYSRVTHYCYKKKNIDIFKITLSQNECFRSVHVVGGGQSDFRLYISVIESYERTASRLKMRSFYRSVSFRSLYLTDTYVVRWGASFKGFSCAYIRRHKMLFYVASQFPSTSE